MAAHHRKLIVTTAIRPDLIGIAADWIWRAFWQSGGLPLEHVHALVAGCDAKVGPPQCFVLLVDDRPVGTASLIASDLEARCDLTPWLAALYVPPEARGRGYAFDLISAVEMAADAAKCDKVWLYTLTAEDLCRKAGWRTAERFAHGDGTAVLMRKTFRGPPRPTTS